MKSESIVIQEIPLEEEEQEEEVKEVPQDNEVR